MVESRHSQLKDLTVNQVKSAGYKNCFDAGSIHRENQGFDNKAKHPVLYRLVTCSPHNLAVLVIKPVAKSRWRM